jgi:hypothetical protein
MREKFIFLTAEYAEDAESRKDEEFYGSKGVVKS